MIKKGSWDRTIHPVTEAESKQATEREVLRTRYTLQRLAPSPHPGPCDYLNIATNWRLSF